MTTKVYIWRMFEGPTNLPGSVQSSITRAMDFSNHLPGPLAAGAAIAASSSQPGSVSNLIGGFGHAAIEVDYNYLSYWPPEEAGESYSISASYEEDQSATRCGRAADRIVQIENLHEEWMLREWDSIANKGFRSIRRNCCTISGKILIGGYEKSTYNSLSNIAKRAFRAAKSPIKYAGLVANVSFSQLVVYTPDTLEELADGLARLTND